MTNRKLTTHRRASHPLLAALLLLGLDACSQKLPVERSEGSPPSAAAGHKGDAPVTTMIGASGAASIDTTSFGNPMLDGGLAPVINPCADGGCDEPVMKVPDNDGFSVADGDCDDFAPLTNPGAYDIPGNGIDEDCDGKDATSVSCDDGLDIADDDPVSAARAIEICALSGETSKHWGVISARWTTPDGVGEPGSKLMHGILPNLGTSFMPRSGVKLLALSSGVARAPGQTGYTRNCSDEFPSDGDFPENFDGKSSTCDVEDRATEVEDSIALELKVRMPTNVTAMSFDSAFFTDEYPTYICSPYNDFFQVLVDPMRTGAAKDGNVVFDLDSNPVSVNNSFLGVCAPGRYGGKEFKCPLGFQPLVGTGFEECDLSLVSPGGLGGIISGRDQKYGASTGWLNTEYKVEPGEVVTLRFTIWDSSDSFLDSLAIIDHVQFRFRDAPPPPEKPMTMPIGPQ